MSFDLRLIHDILLTLGQVANIGIVLTIREIWAELLDCHVALLLGLLEQMLHKIAMSGLSASISAAIFGIPQCFFFLQISSIEHIDIWYVHLNILDMDHRS